jgi:GNAT superfamily N-acetyltransferase
LRLTTRDATPEDAPAIAALRNAVSVALTEKHGPGSWTGSITFKGALWDLRRGKIVLALKGSRIVGTMSIGKIKPWAIDRSYFSKVKLPVYLTSMAVDPELQRQGVGRFMLEAAKQEARDWPANALRLDAFEGDAGAGPFYAKCGFTEVGRNTYRSSKLIYFEWLAPPQP